jgi:hypothetical protein
MFKWISGRQGGGYDKLPIFVSKWLKCDFYLLRFPVGSEVKPHKDVVFSGKHYRLNLTVRKASDGGEFVCEPSNRLTNKRFQFFRPDLHTHSLTKVEGNDMYMLSFGFVR